MITTVNWIPIESSQIKEIAFDAESEHSLGIRFHPSRKQRNEGKEYSEYFYSNVTPEMFAAFRGAESKTRWFESHIKPYPAQYPYFRVT
jgi:hypothetical protein